MKKSNWREEFDAPSAVKKTISEFVDGGVVTVPTAVVATTAAGTATAPAWLPWAVGAGALTATAIAAKGKGKGKKKKKRDSEKPSDYVGKTGSIKNPQ
tara:strand:- start:739 stop:1032 length:294 start_codon:yes stop_codon:yes gene_type:complete